ncbi:hypothetical protein RFI_01033 [Reticulomyxa filosa]|uniref:CASP C-terminal domain-containing protein n=1 Tax=Reticulomyxa filosa TaxID=46433 RepID=X6PEB6_RETFI|nr:hypothetical protein RFI_01033 [Reticulomyxa filosa]|eukprot:ETO36032.1 hypothetical protein RFI_01033 [Reticulomyxa filosa]
MKYAEMYEQQMNPFSKFKQIEKQQRIQNLQWTEWIAYVVGSTVLRFVTMREKKTATAEQIQLSCVECFFLLIVGKRFEYSLCDTITLIKFYFFFSTVSSIIFFTNVGELTFCNFDVSKIRIFSFFNKDIKRIFKMTQCFQKKSNKMKSAK